MKGSRFVYVSYIRTTPTKLWEALTDNAIIGRYWFGMRIESDWKKGSSWKMVREDGDVTDSGDILEISPEHLIEIHWQNEWQPELKAEGFSDCTIELAKAEEATKLTITHKIGTPESKLISAVADGWPLIVSNLKSLLETGKIAVAQHPGH